MTILEYLRSITTIVSGTVLDALKSTSAASIVAEIQNKIVAADVKIDVESVDVNITTFSADIEPVSVVADIINQDIKGGFRC